MFVGGGGGGDGEERDRQTVGGYNTKQRNLEKLQAVLYMYTEY